MRKLAYVEFLRAISSGRTVTRHDAELHSLAETIWSMDVALRRTSVIKSNELSRRIYSGYCNLVSNTLSGLKTRGFVRTSAPCKGYSAPYYEWRINERGMRHLLNLGAR